MEQGSPCVPTETSEGSVRSRTIAILNGGLLQIPMPMQCLDRSCGVIQGLKDTVHSIFGVRSGCLRRHIYKADILVWYMMKVSNAQPQYAAEGIGVVHRDMGSTAAKTNAAITSSPRMLVRSQ